MLRGEPRLPPIAPHGAPMKARSHPAEMQPVPHVPAHPWPAATSGGQRPMLLDGLPPLLARGIINPKAGAENPAQPQGANPGGACGSAGGRACWSLDVRVAVVLVTLAGAVILFLLYRLLLLRHRLRLAKARHALEYYSFYHSATYRLNDPSDQPQDQPLKNGTLGETALTPTPAPLLVHTGPGPVPFPLPPPPPPVSPPPALPLPPPPVLPVPSPSLPATPPLLTLPLPLPLVHTTPPSPHLSWGACSDADIYSRIGAFRPSRLSSLSSHSTVILFEHSSL